MKKDDKRLLRPSILAAAILTAALLLSTFLVTERGNCGDVRWKLHANGRLTMEGDGAVPDYAGPENLSPLAQHSVVAADVKNGVTAIGAETFYDCVNLRRISLPQSVAAIGARAFHGCAMMRSVEIDPGNGAFVFENGSLLTKDGTGLLFHAPKAKGGVYTVPDSVTSLAPEAFYGCKQLTEIVLPAGVKQIGNGAFCGCTKLNMIRLPRDAAFLFEDGILYDADKTAVYFCAPAAAKERVAIADGVTAIAPRAFYGCRSLTSVTLPASVASIGENAFQGCTKLTDLYFSGTKTAFAAVAGAEAALEGFEDLNLHFE